MKKTSYPKIENFNFSGCLEITGNELYLINGGGRREAAENNNQTDSSSSSTPDSYTVQSGDTLSQIVHDYNQANGTNLTVNEVAQLSGIENPDLIHPEQSIVFSNNQSADFTQQVQKEPQISNVAIPSTTNNMTDSILNSKDEKSSVLPSTHNSTNDITSKKFWNLAVEKNKENTIRALYTSAGINADPSNGQLNISVDIGIAEAKFELPEISLLNGKIKIKCAALFGGFTGQATIGVKDYGIGADADLSMLKYSGSVDISIFDVTTYFCGEIFLGGAAAGERRGLGNSHKLGTGFAGGWTFGWKQN